MRPRGIRHVVDGSLTERLRAALPYELTGAQRRTIAEIEADLAGPHPMHRLLQGDVGAGKTLVAVSALLVGVQGGHQGALMAPTEVLAEQHATGVRRLLAGVTVSDPASLFGDRELRVELLTNRVTGAQRKAVLAGLADGSVDIAIGTHALIQDKVEFASLGVVVVDEQHRFGVEQRAALRTKGEGDVVPDVLVMTATPIPRTAAMTVYGDLDVSVLDELPPGPHADRHEVGRRPAAGGRGVGGRARGGGRRSPGLRRVPAGRREREAGGGQCRGDVRPAVAGRAARPASRSAPRADERGGQGSGDGPVPRRAGSTCSSPRPSSRSAWTFRTRR